MRILSDSLIAFLNIQLEQAYQAKEKEKEEKYSYFLDLIFNSSETVDISEELNSALLFKDKKILALEYASISSTLMGDNEIYEKKNVRVITRQDVLDSFVAKLGKECNAKIPSKD